MKIEPTRVTMDMSGKEFRDILIALEWVIENYQYHASSRINYSTLRDFIKEAGRGN